jgi:hypothetical protein
MNDGGGWLGYGRQEGKMKKEDEKEDEKGRTRIRAENGE